MDIDQKSKEELLAEIAELRTENARLKTMNAWDISASPAEQKKAVEALKQSEAKYQALVENSGDTIFLIDNDFKVVYVNKHAAQQFNSSMEQVSGKKVDELFPKQTSQKQMASLQQVFHDKKVLHAEQKIIFPTGEVWLETKLIPVLGDNETVEYVYGISRDVTLQKEASIKIRESEEKYRNLVENSSVGVLRSSTTGEVYYLNDTIARMMEYDSKEELMAQSSVISYKNPAQRDELVRMLKKDGEVQGFEANILTKKGNERVFLMSLKLDHDTILGTLIDISERKKAEEENAKQQQFLKTITSEVQEVIFALDAHGIFTFSEGKGLKKLGLKPGQVVGMSVFDVYKDYPDLLVALKESLSGKVVKTEGVELGSLKFDTTYQPTFDESGKVKGLVGLAVDVTEKKNLEEALLRYQKIVTTSKDMLAVLDHNYTYLTVNDAYVKAFGFKKNDLIGKTVPALFGEEFFETIIKPHADKCLNGKDVNFTDWFEFPAFGRRFMDITYTRYIGSDKEINGFIVTGHDITLRKEAEEQIANSEAKYRSLFDNSPLGKSITGIDGSLKVNKAFSEILGYTEEELKTKKWQEITHPDDIQESSGIVASMMNGGRTRVRYQKRYIHKNGHLVWTDVSTTLQKDSTNKPLYFITTISDITLQKKAEAAIVSEKNHFVQMIDALPGLFYQISPEGQFMKWNKNLEIISGYSSNEMKKISPLDLYEGDEKEKIAQSIQKVFTKGEASVEAKFVSKDGVRTPYYLSGKLIYVDGQPCLIGMGIDMSDEEEATLKLKESEEKFRHAFYKAAIGRAIASLDGKFIQVNPAMCRTLGYTSEELLAKSWMDITHPDSLDIGFTMTKKLLNNEIPSAHYDCMFIHKKGNTVWISLNLILTRNAEGEPHIFIGDMEDITERKIIAERFRNAAENLSDVIYEWDMKESVQWFGKIDELMGYDEGEFPRTLKGWSSLLHPDDLNRVQLTISNHLENGTLYEPEYRVKRKDGSYMYWSTRGNASRNSKNVPISWVGSITNITNRKKAELELRQSNEKLKEAMLNLKHSNKELEQFAYIASHDLQEPLRMVSSYTQLLERRYKDKLDDDAREFIFFAVDGANRMQRLINDLLDYSRVTTRGKPMESLDLNSVLGHAIANLQHKIQETGAMVSNDVLPKCHGDEMQLARVFQNLIDNAIKFKGDTDPRIHISAKEEGDKVVVAVKDNGIGIEQKYQDRIFTIFQRLHSKTEYPGTGIGLAICKRTIERHGGSIRFKNNAGENKGTTFYFSIHK